MALIKFFKVSTLPAQLEGDAFYYVSNGDVAESYLTTSAGVAKSLGNTAMINSLIDAALADFTAQGNAVEIVADIAARNALTAAAESNLMILVLDATGDPTVSAGAALYAYSHANTTTYKVAEYESMDVVIQWANIQGGSVSTPSQIDTAVSQAHSHTNKTVLDKLSDSSGALHYDGKPLTTDWSTNNW